MTYPSSSSRESNTGAPSSRSAAPASGFFVTPSQILPKGNEKRRIARYLRKFDQFMGEVKQHGQILSVRIEDGTWQNYYEIAVHMAVPDEVFGERLYSKALVKLPKARVDNKTIYSFFVLVEVIKRFLREKNIPVTDNVTYSTEDSWW